MMDPVSNDLGSELVLARAVHEVADFVATQGWDRPGQLFALVPTEDLLAAAPTMAEEVDHSAALTPVAQGPLPEAVIGGQVALDEFLATIEWPATVTGCVLVQQIVILPPDAEHDLDEALTPLLADHFAADAAGRAAALSHPDRRDARLFAATLRSGNSLALLQLRTDNDTGEPELRTHPNLAPNLLAALHHTFDST